MCKNIFVVGTTHENFLQYINVIICRTIYFVFFIFVVRTNHENIFMAKFSRSTVTLLLPYLKPYSYHTTQKLKSRMQFHDCITLQGWKLWLHGDEKLDYVQNLLQYTCWCSCTTSFLIFIRLRKAACYMYNHHLHESIALLHLHRCTVKLSRAIKFFKT